MIQYNEDGTRKVRKGNKKPIKLAEGFVKKVGEEVDVNEFIKGAKIIDDTETNPLKKYLRLQRMRKNTPIKGA